MLVRPKGHHQELKVAVVGTERRLFNVFCSHEYLVVAATQVKLGEELSVAELVEELINDRNREHVVHLPGIERHVVDVEAPAVIELLHQQHR
jgi:hypothetical protein